MIKIENEKTINRLGIFGGSGFILASLFFETTSLFNIGAIMIILTILIAISEDIKEIKEKINKK